MGTPDFVAAGQEYERRHDAARRQVFADARSGGARIGAEQLVAASRIYTPPHIVEFLLVNSLGAMWLEMYPAMRRRVMWPMLVRDALGPPRPPRPVRELRLLDPCCGCGAFLLAAFDLFAELYALERELAEAEEIPAEWAVAPTNVAATIVAGNLHGADLDTGAVAVTDALLRERAGDVTTNLTVVQPPLGALDRAIWAGERFDVVATNPPYVGFRLMDPALKEAVRTVDPLARSDLAAVFQRRSVELVADGGRCATVTPASWLTSREAVELRREILDTGGPRLTAALGQRVFAQAPLLFVGLSVIDRGNTPEDLVVLRPPVGSGRDGLAAAAADPDLTLGTHELRRLPSHPFLPAAPASVLALAGKGPTVGDLFRSFDGIWTGDTARDVRYWWELDPDDDGWARLSGGQGNEAWSGPIRRRIRREFAAGQPDRTGTIEYARVAGGRLAARLAVPGTAAQAGIVTLVPNGPEGAERIEEVLAIFNSRIGTAWLRTLTSGLNFNPGYAAQIPLGSELPPQELRDAVRRLIRLRERVAERDPTSDTFVDTLPPWEPDTLSEDIAATEQLVESLLAAHLALAPNVLAGLPPVTRPTRRIDRLADHLGVRVLALLGFRWPSGRGPEVPLASITRGGATASQLAEGLGALLTECRAGGPGFDPCEWVGKTFLPHHTQRFRGRPIVVADGATRFRIGRE